MLRPGYACSLNSGEGFFTAVATTPIPLASSQCLPGNQHGYYLPGHAMPGAKLDVAHSLAIVVRRGRSEFWRCAPGFHSISSRLQISGKNSPCPAPGIDAAVAKFFRNATPSTRRWRVPICPGSIRWRRLLEILRFIIRQSAEWYARLSMRRMDDALVKDLTPTLRCERPDPNVLTNVLTFGT